MYQNPTSANRSNMLCSCYPGQAESGRLYGFHDGGVDMREPHVPHLGQGMCRYLGVQHTLTISCSASPCSWGTLSSLAVTRRLQSVNCTKSGQRGSRGALGTGISTILSLLRSKIQLYSPRSYVLPGAHGLLAQCDTSQFPSGGSCLISC